MTHTSLAHRHAPGCGCVAPVLDRRRALALGLGAAGALLLAGRAAHAADGKTYEAMLVSCIDPRLIDEVHGYMNGRQLLNQYSHFAIAGAAIAVVAPAFKDWQPAFWDNLAATIQLHSIKRVIAVNHRDCGAAKIAYGEDKVKTAEAETTLHRDVLGQFRQEVQSRRPSLKIETGLMALDGTVEMLG